ncbi:hypothetical protein X777_05484, partial [Ooceraea biroi]
QIERESGINQRSVLRILHRHKFHPYHLSLHQALHGMDFVNRIAFCKWAQQQIRINDSFFDNKIIGPHFIDEHLIGNNYANFLEHNLGHLLEDLPLIIRRTMWYQHDGCPAYFSLVARNKLNEKFANRWIGRGGPVGWPARSPDLTPLDFFLWETLKDMVYKEEPTTPQIMRQRIIEACASITLDVIRRANHQ